MSTQLDSAMTVNTDGLSAAANRAGGYGPQALGARRDRSCAGADRQTRSRAELVHRHHRRSRTRHSRRGRCHDRRRPEGRAARRRAVRGEEPVRRKGLATRAGSKINRDLAPSPRDATLIERMEAAGAVLVGALNMGEYAYDFTGENVHDGPSRNPHDPTRMTGGSSGGSGSAVGGGLVPIALGSDTNGSIRVPSSFCGIFGLKPTYGRLSRARSFPLSQASIISARSRAASAISRWPMMRMQGPDADDAACTTRPVEPAIAAAGPGHLDGLRVAVAGGYFQKNVFPEAVEAVARVAKALDVDAQRSRFPRPRVPAPWLT